MTELAKHASPEGRILERTIAVVAQSCRTRSLSCKTVQQAREKLTSIKQGTLLTEVRSMDEERRSLAELLTAALGDGLRGSGSGGRRFTVVALELE